MSGAQEGRKEASPTDVAWAEDLMAEVVATRMAVRRLLWQVAVYCGR